MGFQKGYIPYNKGIPNTPEQKVKISKALKETYKKGRKNYFKELSKLPKEFHPRYKNGKPFCRYCGKRTGSWNSTSHRICWLKNRIIPRGMKRSLESRKKMSLAGKRYASKNYSLLKKRLVGALQKQQKMKEPTSIEKKLYDELKKRGFLFETQKLVNGRFIVDAYIPSLNLIIEADGDYWHTLPRVKNKDRAENAYLTKCGFRLLRLSESEINHTSFGERIG